MEYGNLVILVVFVGFMWFLMIRPQQAQQKKRREMLASLKAGDKIVTVGGFHGTIKSIQDDSAQIRISENLTVKLARSGIGTRLESNDTND